MFAPKRRRTGLLLCAFVVVIGGRVDAGPSDPAGFDEKRAQILAAQPPGVSMELRLPKTRFYQGEIIPATLVFRNASGQKYHAWMGTYDRSGRIPSLSFEAVDRDGRPVVDALKPYLSPIGGGLGNDTDLGSWEITLPANQWLRFDRPGSYRIVARSQRVVAGSKEDIRTEGAPAPQVIALVSQVIDVQIDPLTPAQEQEVLVQAKADFTSDDREARHKAVERLRYLQTPRAREMLLPLVGQENDAYLALAGAPDPSAEADRLLEAVASGRVALQPNAAQDFATLKTAMGLHSRDEPALRAVPEAVRAWLRRGTWNAVAQTDLAELLRLNPRDAEARAMLAVHQTELDGDFSDRLLLQLSGDSSASVFTLEEQRDFLPLIRRAANPPRRSGAALRMFARLAPDEARKLIVETVRHPPFGYRHEKKGVRYARQVHFDAQPLCALPDGTLLPELDETLRRRLRHPADQNSEDDEGIEMTMILTARYGTPALLPDMLAVYRPQVGRWNCDIEKNALHFWLRCDPAGGARGLDVALHTRGGTGCYHSMLVDVLQNDWHEEALPVVLAALDDPDEEVWLAASQVLARHAAGPEAAEKMVTAVERISARPLSDHASDHDTSVYRQDRLVTLLLEGKDWGLTDAQWQRLLALPNSRKSTREQIERRLANGTR